MTGEAALRRVLAEVAAFFGDLLLVVESDALGEATLLRPLKNTSNVLQQCVAHAQHHNTPARARCGRLRAVLVTLLIVVCFFHMTSARTSFCHKMFVLDSSVNSLFTFCWLPTSLASGRCRSTTTAHALACALRVSASSQLRHSKRPPPRLARWVESEWRAAGESHAPATSRSSASSLEWTVTLLWSRWLTAGFLFLSSNHACFPLLPAASRTP